VISWPCPTLRLSSGCRPGTPPGRKGGPPANCSSRNDTIVESQFPYNAIPTQPPSVYKLQWDRTCDESPTLPRTQGWGNQISEPTQMVGPPRSALQRRVEATIATQNWFPANEERDQEHYCSKCGSPDCASRVRGVWRAGTLFKSGGGHARFVREKTRLEQELNNLARSLFPELQVQKDPFRGLRRCPISRSKVSAHKSR